MINFEALAAKVNEVSNRGSRREYFKNPAKLGEIKYARLLPIPERLFLPDEPVGLPLLIDKVYRNILPGSIAIPEEGTEDPVQDAIAQLHEAIAQAEGDGDKDLAKSLQDVVKALYPKVRYLGFVVERDKKTKEVISGPLIWEPYQKTSQSIMIKMQKIYSEEEVYVNDPKFGYDLEFTRVEEGGRVDVEFARRPSSLGDEEAVQGILDSIPDRDSLTRKLSVEELREAVTRFIDNGGKYVKPERGSGSGSRGKSSSESSAADKAGSVTLNELESRLNREIG